MNDQPYRAPRPDGAEPDSGVSERAPPDGSGGRPAARPGRARPSSAVRGISTPERILAAASELFSVEGVRASSVDAIAARAGVSKRTLYYHFRSKDDLIGEWLSGEDQAAAGVYLEWLGPPGTPMEIAIAAFFDRLASAAADRRWKGCGFARAATELAGMPGHPGVRAARAHKRGVETLLRARLHQDGIACAEKLARRISVIIEGAVIQVLVHQDTRYMTEAGELAAELVAGSRCKRPALPEPTEGSGCRATSAAVAAEPTAPHDVKEAC